MLAGELGDLLAGLDVAGGFRRILRKAMLVDSSMLIRLRPSLNRPPPATGMQENK